MRRMISETKQKWLNGISENIVANGTATEVGGNLEVDGKAVINSGLEVDGNIVVNDFYNIKSKLGELHFTQVQTAEDEDIEIYDASGENTFVKILISDADGGLTVYEYAYTESDGWLKVASAGDTEKFDNWMSADGTILTIIAGYDSEIRVISFHDVIAI